MLTVARIADFRTVSCDIDVSFANGHYRITGAKTSLKAASASVEVTGTVIEDQAELKFVLTNLDETVKEIGLSGNRAHDDEFVPVKITGNYVPSEITFVTEDNTFGRYVYHYTDDYRLQSVQLYYDDELNYVTSMEYDEFEGRLVGKRLYLHNQLYQDGVVLDNTVRYSYLSKVVTATEATDYSSDVTIYYLDDNGSAYKMENVVGAGKLTSNITYDGKGNYRTIGTPYNTTVVQSDNHQGVFSGVNMPRWFLVSFADYTTTPFALSYVNNAYRLETNDKYFDLLQEYEFTYDANDYPAIIRQKESYNEFGEPQKSYTGQVTIYNITYKKKK